MTTGFIDVDGVRLECRWSGAPDAGPAIVLLHEGLGSVAMWKDFPDQLAARTGRPVFAYSRRGYGQSDPIAAPRQPDYMHVEALEVLPKVLKAAGVARPILLGHSDGGSIALIHAGAYPASTAGLVLEAPHVFVEPLTVQSIAQAKVVYETTDLPRKLGRHHRDADHAFWGWNDIWLDDRFLAWNIEASLPTIDCPILLLQGLDDEYGTRAQLDAIAAGTPDTEILMLPRCGHSPHRDQTEAVLEALETFVRRVAGVEA
ncbi:alpha/beta fold hydrolase [Phenylobacterium sp.]|jgi:pimeloyl-ACP methyl ester carboxylesterase|uniref:alpha/beta fold hydrolase n=1 Tax=Phenylobacterium sp. TaxID=1871053 RepID=UPI0037850DEB